MKTIGLGAVATVLLISVTFPSATLAATVTHEATVGAITPFSTQEVTETITESSTADIDRDIDVTQTIKSWAGRSAIGKIGSVGMAGELVNVTDVSVYTTRVLISNDENFNFLGVPQRATLNFIIDGGFITMFAFDSLVEYQLDVAGSFIGPGGAEAANFRSIGTLAAATNGSLTFRTSGDDIGAFYDPPTNTAEIPLSFHSMELGIVSPGESIFLIYSMFMQWTALTGSDPFVEFVQWGFSDPGSLSLSPVLVSVDFSPVPVPAAAWLFGSALGVLAWHRRRATDALA